MQKSLICGFAALLALTGFRPAQADQITIQSSSTAQVGKNGPSASQEFMDIEGIGNGNASDPSRFASFGVVEFNTVYSGLGGTGIDPNLTLEVVDSPFSQTRPGVLDFYLVTDNAASILPGSSLAYQTAAASAPEGLGSQLGTAFFLGSGNYTSTSGSPTGNDAAILDYNLTLNASAQSYFLSQFNSPTGVIRIAITPDTSGSNPKNVVGSLAGFDNGFFNGNAPTLTFNAVPEPGMAPTLLASIGVISLFAARCRKRA